MRSLFGLVVLSAAGLLAAEDGPVTLKVKPPGPGDTTSVVKTDDATTTIKIVAGGQEQTKVEKKATELVYAETVVERPAGATQPTKMKRAYKSATLTTDGKAADLGLTGKTVLIAKDGDKWSAVFDGGGDLPKMTADLLLREVDRQKAADEDMLPKKEVKAGDTWPLPIDKLAKELGGPGGVTIDAAQSGATGKLVKTYRKGDKLFAVVEYTMKLAVTQVNGAQQIPAKAGSVMNTTMTLDGNFDGTLTEGKATIAVTARILADVPGAELTIDIDQKGTKTVTAVK